MERNKWHIELDYATRITLFTGICSGVFSVFVDYDHILCAVKMGIPLLPVKGIYGCKLWNAYIIPLGWIVGGLAIAWLLGFVLYVAYHAVKSTDNLLETRQAGESRRY